MVSPIPLYPRLKFYLLGSAVGYTPTFALKIKEFYKDIEQSVSFIFFIKWLIGLL